MLINLPKKQVDTVEDTMTKAGTVEEDMMGDTRRRLQFVNLFYMEICSSDLFVKLLFHYSYHRVQNRVTFVP